MKLNKKNIFYIILVFLFTFQMLLQKYVSIFQYFDEFYALISIPLIVKKKKIDKVELEMIIIFFVLNIIGILSSIIYNYQPLEAVFTDILLINKFFMGIITTKILFKNLEYEKERKVIKNFCGGMILLLFAFALMDILFNVFPAEFTYRFGLKPVQLFFSHPMVLLYAMFFLLSNFILFNDEEILNKKDIIVICCDILVMCMTLRTKAFASALVTVLLCYYIFKRKKRIKLNKIIILGAMILLIAYSQIQVYFVNNKEDSARAMLLEKSIVVAKDHFPLGSGFGTFGSFSSGVYYSPLYYRYRLSNVHGLQFDNRSFISDSFWPMILAQFGFFGVILYITFIVVLFKNIQKVKNLNMYAAGAIVIIFLIIASSSESAFVHPLGMTFALPLGFILEKNKKEVK